MPEPLHHPDLGSLQGYHSPTKKISEYRNIKYASIPSRFHPPIPVVYLSLSVDSPTLDCTKFGPSCPQHPSGFVYDLNLVGPAKELEEEMSNRKNDTGTSEEDEFECLNLVVTAPEGNYEELLPVVVWYVLFELDRYKC